MEEIYCLIMGLLIHIYQTSMENCGLKLLYFYLLETNRQLLLMPVATMISIISFPDTQNSRVFFLPQICSYFNLLWTEFFFFRSRTHTLILLHINFIDALYFFAHSYKRNIPTTTLLLRQHQISGISATFSNLVTNFHEKHQQFKIVNESQ